MKKIISILVTLCMSTVLLSACSNKEDDKNKDFDTARRKIEQNASNDSTGGSSSISPLTANNANTDAIKKVTDFENYIKGNNEVLKSAYNNKIQVQKGAMELRLKEKLELDLERINLGMDSSLKKYMKSEDKKQQQTKLRDKYKEELDKQRKVYEDKINKLKKVFDDYDNKIKGVEAKRDVVIRAMTILDENRPTTKKALNDTKDEIAKNIVKTINKEVINIEFNKYKDSINEVVKWRNNELLKIK
ncbi:hypothetical protein FDB54_11970 [Clostridium botulinum]|nr:hypothetical protein [Clostridium botulinum]